jgi:hypothetical protein
MVVFISRLIVFLIFAGWSVGLTYPLVLHPVSHIPLGDEKAGTVPFLNLWTLQWNIDQLMQGYPRYWDAPIFAPARGTFAFSEPQPLSALLAAPLWLGLQAPALAYNALVLLFLVLNGWFAYLLLRGWGLPQLPALMAGLFVQSLPFIAQEMGVLQLTALFGLLWSLLYLNRSLASKSWQWSNFLGLGLALPFTFFTCAYYGLFSLLFLPLAFICQFRPKQLNFSTSGQLLATTLLALGLAGPFVWAQHERLSGQGLNRSTSTIESNSARLEDYGKFLDHNIWYSQILGLKSQPGQRLFPGLGLTLLAGLGFLAPLRPGVKVYLFLATLLALVLSLGLRLRLGEFVPYQVLREYAPGFDQLRSPFRFAAFVQLHLGLLAGLGLYRLSRKKVVQVLLAAPVIFEALALPLPLQPMPALQSNTPWQTWLNTREEPPTLVRLPFAPGSAVTEFEWTTRWMLEGRYLQGDMVNGYSGFFPPDHRRLRDEMVRFPTPEGLILLRAKGVDYIVVNDRLIDAQQAATIGRHLPLVFEDPHHDISIYALAGAP